MVQLSDCQSPITSVNNEKGRLIMRYVECGNQNSETVILLHGGGLSWWNYRDVAQLLSDRFHVVLPILDGYAGSDAPFTSVEENAARIIAHACFCLSA